MSDSSWREDLNAWGGEQTLERVKLGDEGGAWKVKNYSYFYNLVRWRIGCDLLMDI